MFHILHQGRLIRGAPAEVPPGDPLRDRGPGSQIHRLWQSGQSPADAQAPRLYRSKAPTVWMPSFHPPPGLGSLLSLPLMTFQGVIILAGYNGTNWIP